MPFEPGPFNPNVDTDGYDYSGYDTDSPMSVVKRSGGHLPMRRIVYNLEVANTHSYFVGELGLWVHNTSGVDASIKLARLGLIWNTLLGQSFWLILPALSFFARTFPCRHRPA